MPDPRGGPNFNLVLGYDPLQGQTSRSHNVTRQHKDSGRQSRDSRHSNPLADARSRGLSTPSSSSSSNSQRRPQRSINSVANTSRSSSRHLAVPIPETPSLRDSIADDRFFQAYYEPGLTKLSDDWQVRLAREHESDRIVRHPSAASSARSRIIPRKLSLRPKSTADHQMPALHVRIVGHNNAGKSRFILNALGLPMGKSTSGLVEQVKVEEQTVLLSVSELEVPDGILQDSYVLSQAAEQWEASPLRIDGAVILYDVTNAASTEAIPTIMRTYQRAGIPSILVSTKHDSDDAPEINPDLYGSKARLWDKSVTVFQTSASSRDSAKAALMYLLRDVLERQTDEDRCITQSRPTTGISKRRESSSKSSRHARTGSDYSSSTKESENSAIAAEPVSPTTPSLPPIPRLAAQAIRRESSQDIVHQNDSQEQLRPAGSITNASSNSLGSTLNDDADDERDAAIISTQQTYAQSVASFDELADQLVRPFETEADAKFVDRFLAFFRVFSTAQRLLEAIITRCIRAYRFPEPKRQVSVEHIFRVLSVWLKRYPGDFALEKTAERLDEFLTSVERGSPSAPTENIRLALQEVEESDDTAWGVSNDEDPGSTSSITVGSSHSSARPISQPSSSRQGTRQSNQVEDNLFFRNSALTLTAMGPSLDTISLTSARTKEKLPEIAQRQAVKLVPAPRTPLSKDRWRRLLDIPDRDIAEELTRIDWIMFCSVKPRDLIRDVSVSLRNRSQFIDLANVSRMIDHFNHVAYWATNLMLLRDKPQHRAQMWLKLARVARKLRELNSYNALGAIVAGMESTAVHRLAATKSLVSEADQKDFIKLQLLMSTSRGHFSYRMAWDNTSGARVPFLPLHRRDLVVAEQGNKTLLTRKGKDGCSEQLVNWTKFDIMGSIVTDLQRAQATMHPNYRGSEAVRALLLDCKIQKDDDELYERSVAIEPNLATAKGPTSAARRRLQPWLVRYGLSQA